MEFKVITDLTALPQIIETNAEELKAWLSEKMEHYNGIVVTADSIQVAKSDKAALNKLRTALEERRKEVKRQCMAPYEAFEVKYKELLALIDEPIKSIDIQVKTFEEQALSEKRNRLEAHFADCICAMDIPINVEFERILNPKWKNKTMKESDLTTEIYQTLCRIQEDVQEIRTLYAESPHLTAVMNCYAQGYDKGCALAYAAALVLDEQRQQQRDAQSRTDTGIQQAHSATEQQPQQVSPELPTEEPPVASAQTQRLGTVTFCASGTKEQIIKLRDFMLHENIQFQVVKER